MLAFVLAAATVAATAQEPGAPTSTPSQPVLPVVQEAQRPEAEKPAAADLPKPAPLSALEIVRKSVELDQREALLMRQKYTWQFREVERDVDKDGNVKKTTINTYDHLFLYDHPHNRLIAKNDQPLSEKDEREEEKKIQKLKDEFEHESEAKRQKRHAERDKEIEESRKFLRQIPDAYDFEIKGEETVNGRDTWMIALTPRPDFKPTVKFADILKKIRATIWIDKQEYRWAKVDAQLIEDATFGLFIARLHKGARLQFEQMKVNDELWCMRWSHVEGSARIALFVNERGDEETTFSNYRKFTAEAKITGVSEMPAETKPPQP
jgi:hypothetical protein